MSESSLQQDRSAPTNEPSKLQNNASSTYSDFWDGFCLFPLRFEEYSFDHWYIFIYTYYPILLFLEMIYDINNNSLDFSNGFRFSMIKFELTDWLFISSVAVVCIAPPTIQIDR